jgi:hypothetical protein
LNPDLFHASRHPNSLSIVLLSSCPDKSGFLVLHNEEVSFQSFSFAVFRFRVAKCPPPTRHRFTTGTILYSFPRFIDFILRANYPSGLLIHAGYSEEPFKENHLFSADARSGSAADDKSLRKTRQSRFIMTGNDAGIPMPRNESPNDIISGHVGRAENLLDSLSGRLPPQE